MPSSVFLLQEQESEKAFYEVIKIKLGEAFILWDVDCKLFSLSHEALHVHGNCHLLSRACWSDGSDLPNMIGGRTLTLSCGQAFIDFLLCVTWYEGDTVSFCNKDKYCENKAPNTSVYYCWWIPSCSCNTCSGNVFSIPFSGVADIQRYFLRHNLMY